MMSAIIIPGHGEDRSEAIIARGTKERAHPSITSHGHAPQIDQSLPVSEAL
jgi:hypothetical protein